MKSNLPWLKEQLEVRTDYENCWEWPFGRSGGYGMMWFKSKRNRAHVVSLILFTGEEPAGRCSLHSCDNKGCINPKHLRWGTLADNNRDKVERGQSNVKPAQLAKRKLSDEQVKGIRQSLETESIRKVAKDFGTNTSSIWHIRAGKTYADVA